MNELVRPVANSTLARKIPYPFAKSKGILLAQHDGHLAHVYLRADAAAETLAETQRVLGVPLKASLLSIAEFDQALARAYAQAEGSAAAMVEDVEQDMDLSQLVQDLPQTEDLLDAENDAPVIRMINALLTQAVRENASDIHIEPFETRSVVRFRIDGTLKDVIEPHRALHAAMASRIKIMAELDIAEKRLPQDGRITLRLAGRPVDVRVSTLPTGHGERVVLRLLDKDAGRLELSRLGMQGETLVQMDTLVKQPHGIVLVTGPTGSGKTTTLYAALSRIDATVTNVMTVEDPIEYDLDGIGQRVDAALQGAPGLVGVLQFFSHATSASSLLCDYGQDLAGAQDQELVTFGRLVLGTRVLAVDDLVALFDVDGDALLAVLIPLAVAHSDDLAHHRLLFGRVGQHDAAGGLLIFFDRLDDDAVFERLELHAATLLFFHLGSGTLRRRVLIHAGS